MHTPHCPATSRISLCLRITLPPLGQLRPWSSENPFPQPSQVLGRRSRGLLKRMANPSRNSSADKTVLFFSLGMADSQAPVEKSLAPLAQRSERPPRADTHVSNFVGSSFSRLSRASWRALATDSLCLPGSNSSFPVMAFTRWMVALRDTPYATGADVDGFVTPRPRHLDRQFAQFPLGLMKAKFLLTEQLRCSFLCCPIAYYTLEPNLAALPTNPPECSHGV